MSVCVEASSPDSRVGSDEHVAAAAADDPVVTLDTCNREDEAQQLPETPGCVRVRACRRTRQRSGNRSVYDATSMCCMSWHMPKEVLIHYTHPTTARQPSSRSGDPATAICLRHSSSRVAGKVAAVKPARLIRRL